MQIKACFSFDSKSLLRRISVICSPLYQDRFLNTLLPCQRPNAKEKRALKKIDLCRFHCRYKKFFEPHLKEPCWIVISTCRCSPGVKPVKSCVKQCRLIHHATTKSTLELDFGPHVDQLIVREGPFSLIWNKILYTTF